MDLSVGLVFVIAFLVAYYLFKTPTKLPPGPLCLPVVGSMFFLQRNKNKRRHEVFSMAAKEYGSIMAIQLGSRLAVVLDGYDMIHEAFVKNADVFSDRPKQVGIFDQVLTDIPGRGVLWHPYGNSWRMLRKFTVQALRDFGVGKTSIEQKIFAEVEAITKCLDDSKGNPVALNPLLQKAIGNVLYGIVFGRRYDYDDPEFEKIRQLSTIIISGQGLFSPSAILPRCIAKHICRKEVETQDERVKSVMSVKDYVFQQIDDHEATFDPANIRDFIDIYLQTREDSASDKDQITKGSMLRVILDMFLAGSETTSTTLDWSFLYMIEFPEVQNRCQKEIDEVVGQKPIEYKDLQKLPYVAATLQEIQRVSTVVSIAPPHQIMKETTLGGYTIPTGTMVLANLYSVSFDPKQWDNPKQFNPSRFIDESGKYVKRAANIPFSEGPRVCLGEPLARMKLFVVFANLLQRFEFRRESDSGKTPLEPKLTQLTNCPNSYKVRVSRRL